LRPRRDLSHFQLEAEKMFSERFRGGIRPQKKYLSFFPTHKIPFRFVTHLSPDDADEQ